MDEQLCYCRMNPDGHVPGWVLDCESGAPDPDGEE